jgi:hypothetical protein
MIGLTANSMRLVIDPQAFIVGRSKFFPLFAFQVCGICRLLGPQG